ncbi:GNAT family N-acetyltransferase [Cohnella sp. CFH 77786]|uniref:GNAT family N-acetyltransferase n=1 Tax=Cohnella sp. CFH 77786 TaxID=2662265 RepID=UPI001C60F6FB|nr:GNAT family protein [Cohnella sp. CFH 77786]MBW5448669.1 GNAT family N-acetyltransferase [Cohnella sp. CFH 77786]
MTFQLRPMTENDARRICEWRYPAPYERYNWPDWERMIREGREFADPDIRSSQYRSVYRGANEFAAYIQLFPLDRAIRIGLGLRPDLCGAGLGAEVVRLAVREAIRRRPEAEIDLEVETWNLRAIKAYEKAGFAAEDEYGKPAAVGIVQVLCMVWRPPVQPPARGTVE